MNPFTAGTWVRQRSYRSFQPSLINRQWFLDDIEIQTLLSQADRQLKRNVDEEIQTLGTRSAPAARLLEALYQNPFIEAEGVSRVCDVSMPTAYKLIADLEDLGILSEITGNRRNRKYLFKRYLQLFQ